MVSDQEILFGEALETLLLLESFKRSALYRPVFVVLFICSVPILFPTFVYIVYQF